ncbi:hypothetical protein ASPVEDRAFT_274801 [Aspergillus versicolor CBS 583.65]|uniref:Hydrophobin n=1 Tax=Aspergillus versicolor CBS 583.65 TaxID=1036611 RepID=A0A1L9P6J8_ASPVE|nr:uncharacterized protein ASPVEDRAFT_274801 [Aspergillus versicolor CBS 583.65]OJI97150.1 hypothetical protein ASPVEDRAFT_274801 [Aspergillus versicolor CBS 583.65]
MHFSISATSLLVALSLTAPTMAGRPWFCELSKDVSNIQTPFCCDGFIPAKDSKVSFEGVNCEDVSKQNPFSFECPKGGEPRCCYSIGPKQICTSTVKEGETD